MKAEEKVLGLIAPEDLRFGNLLDVGGLYAPCGIGAVLEISIDSVTINVSEKINVYLYEDLKPIHLSPEWLERAGAVQNRNINNMWHWVADGFHFRYDIDNRQFAILVPIPESEIPAKYFIKMDFLHELQNTWKTLTGNELKIT